MAQCVLSVVCLLLALVASAALPKGWYRNDWKGYQPYATMAAEEGPLPGTTAMVISNVVAKHGFGILENARHPAVAGDRVRITFLARGRGHLGAAYVSFTETGDWNGIGSSRGFALTDDWRLYEAELTVTDKFFKRPTGRIQANLTGSTGTDCRIADVRTEVVKGRPDPAALPETRVLENRKFALQEDFERTVRGGESLTTDIAPGLLSKTKIGVYRTDSKLMLPYSVRSAAVPSGTNAALAVGSRLYSLKGVFTTRLAKLALALRTVKPVKVIEGVLTDGAREVGRFRVPRRVLPADFRIDVNGLGGWGVTVTSLSDSSVRTFCGTLGRRTEGSAEVGWDIAAEQGSNGGVAADNLEVFGARVVAKSRDVPYVIDRFETFDPAKAGWPLVFEDEFEGDSIDWSKWYFPHYSAGRKDCVFVDGKGHLVVEAHTNATGKLETDGIWSMKALEYGWFEARVRFTRKPGWWAAFWLYGPIDTNPFVDGFEVDIFEDYYTRPREPGEAERDVLDHNNHVRIGATTKSWNFNSHVPGDFGDWHVIACKWTPFEISYYMDGRLMPSKAGHGAYDSVTFDAIHHFAGITPLHAICSGQIQRHGKFSAADYPERYLVDRVRLYAYPQPADEFPSVAWTRGADDPAFAPAGSMLSFSVTAEAKKGRKLTGVYLFDNGFLVDHRTEPPYDFSIRFSGDAYEHTNYMKPGRSGVKPKFDGYSHVFVAFAQDESGRVSHTEPIWRIPAKCTSVPFEGIAQKVPGEISAIRFDAGGRGVSQYTKDGRNKHWTPTRTNDTVTASRTGYIGTLYGGDWINYTVDVATASDYEVRATIGTGVRQRAGLRLFLDGKPIGRLALDSFTTWKRGEADDCGVTTVRLPSGRRVLTVGIEGGLSIRKLTLTPAEN